GQPKPLHFKENKKPFAPFLDRITHVVVQDLPQNATAWEREVYQRNCISRGLPNYPAGNPDDVLIVSDVDEIPRAEAIREAAQNLTGPRRLVMDAHCSWLNLRTGVWEYAVLLPCRNLMPPNAIRQSPLGYGQPVADAGWHFSYLGGAKQVSKKFAAFS